MSFFRYISLIVATSFLVGCSSNEVVESLRFSKKAPDEFQVKRQAPLTLPDSFALPTPAPEGAKPSAPVSKQAEYTLFQKTEHGTTPEQPSAGELSLLNQTGQKQENIRTLLEDENKKLLSERLKYLGFVGEWVAKRHDKSGNVPLDPVAEKQRINTLLTAQEHNGSHSSSSF